MPQGTGLGKRRHRHTIDAWDAISEILEQGDDRQMALSRRIDVATMSAIMTRFEVPIETVIGVVSGNEAHDALLHSGHLELNIVFDEDEDPLIKEAASRIL